MSAENWNILAATQLIASNAEHHKKKIKQLCTNSSVISMDIFCKQFEIEAAEFDNEQPDTNGNSVAGNSSDAGISLSAFADAFKTFEEYPSNIARPAKILNESERLNVTLTRGTPRRAKSNATLLCENSAAQQTPSSLAQAHNSISDQYPSPREIYADFEMFQKKLEKLKEQTLTAKSVSAEYTRKLQQVHLLEQQLEKLHPKSNFGKPCAFNTEEEKKLHLISENLQQAISIASAEDYCHTDDGTTPSANELHELVDIVRNIQENVHL